MARSRFLSLNVKIFQFITFVSGRAESNRRTLPWEGSIVPLNYARIVVAGAVVIMLLLRYPRQQTVLIIIQAG